MHTLRGGMEVKDELIICSKHALGALEPSKLGIAYESEQCPLCAAYRQSEHLNRLQRIRNDLAKRAEETAAKLDLRWREADAMASALERHGAGESVRVLEKGIRERERIHATITSKLSKIDARIGRNAHKLERLRAAVEAATHVVVIELARLTFSAPSEESVRRAIAAGRVNEAVRDTAQLLIESSSHQKQRRTMIEENLPTIEAAYKLSMDAAAHGDEASTGGLSEVE